MSRHAAHEAELLTPRANAPQGWSRWTWLLRGETQEKRSPMTEEAPEDDEPLPLAGATNS